MELILRKSARQSHSKNLLEMFGEMGSFKTATVTAATGVQNSKQAKRLPISETS